MDGEDNPGGPEINPQMTFRIDVIDTYKEFKQLRPNWDALYLIDPDAQLFLSWDWLSQQFHREPDRIFFILAVRPDVADSDYVAFFPLRLSLRKSKDDQGFHNEIYMAGNYWADYTGIICDPQYDQQAIPAFAAHLKQMYWSKIHLDYVRDSAGRLELFISQFPDDQFDVAHTTRISREDGVDGLICPHVDLPDSFESHLANNMSANTRQKLRRFMRKVADSDAFHITHTNAATCERDLEILGSFWMNKWAERKAEQVDRLGVTYQQILHQALRADMLHMPILWRGDQPLGVLGSLVDWRKKTLLFYVAGRDESCRDVPPGLILHGHSICWAIEHGLKTYDLLSGNEPYKYSLGARERRLKCAVLSTKSAANHNGQLDPRSVDDALERSTSAHKKGKLARAENGYRQVLQVLPDCAPALRRWARLCCQTGDHAQAQDLYQRLVACQPDNAAAWIGLGRACIELGGYRDAQTALERAVGLVADRSIEARYLLGRSRIGSGDDAAAAEAFRAALELKPENSEDEIHQGRAREALDISLARMANDPPSNRST